MEPVLFTVAVITQQIFAGGCLQPDHSSMHAYNERLTPAFQELPGFTVVLMFLRGGVIGRNLAMSGDMFFCN